MASYPFTAFIDNFAERDAYASKYKLFTLKLTTGHYVVLAGVSPTADLFVKAINSFGKNFTADEEGLRGALAWAKNHRVPFRFRWILKINPGRNDDGTETEWGTVYWVGLPERLAYYE